MPAPPKFHWYHSDEYPAGRSFGELLEWHFLYWGTRPIQRKKKGKPWVVWRFAAAAYGESADKKDYLDFDSQTKNLLNWRMGINHPDHPEIVKRILEVLFGDGDQFEDWRADLENALTRPLERSPLPVSTTDFSPKKDSTSFFTPRSDRRHIGAAASVGVSLVTNELAKHFYGRESDLALIDDFVNARMEGSERSLLLITAPAGFGKSALATTWCNKSEAVPNRHIAKHFCAISAGEATTSVRKIHASLRKQISEVYADGIDASDDDDALAALLALSPPGNVHLVVWIDGIDEASAPIPCFLPDRLGDRVCVIISARADPKATPGYVYDWQFSLRATPHQPFRHPLGAFSLAGVQAMVEGLFGAAAIEHPSNLGELIFRASELGYPLFARLMAEDAVKAAKSGGQVDFGEAPGSLFQYLERQLRLLRGLDTWAAHQPLFVFLTFALDAVRIDEFPSLIGRAISPELIPDQIFRWFKLTKVDQPSRHRLLAIVHPKIAQLFAAILDDERLEWARSISRHINKDNLDEWPRPANGALSPILKSAASRPQARRCPSRERATVRTSTSAAPLKRRAATLWRR